jgi:hypothetical protein
MSRSCGPALRALLIALTCAPLAAQDCNPAWVMVPTSPVGPGTHQVLGIAGVGGDEVWVVGTFYDPAADNLAALALRRSNGAWTATSPPALPGGDVMKSVDGFAPGDVWAVGGDGLAYAFHYDGAAWSGATLPKPGPLEAGISVDDVLALAPDDVWAVGHYDETLTAELRTATWHWDGAAWSVVPSPNAPRPGGGVYPSTLASIAAAGPDALIAVGEWRVGNTWLPLAMRWDGAAWTLLAPPASAAHGDGRLRSVSARSAQEVWAVGTCGDATGVVGGGFGEAFALRFNGTAWTEIAVPQPSFWNVNPLNAVLADGQSVLAVGSWENGSQGLDTFAVRFDGTAFEMVPSPGVFGFGEGWNQLHDLARVDGAPWAAGEGNYDFFSATVPLLLACEAPCAGSVALAGTGTPGCAGPLGIAAGSVPSIGNAAFAITASGLPPSEPAVVLLGTAADEAGTQPGGLGVLLHVDLAASTLLLPIVLSTGPNGQAVLPMPIPDNAAFVGSQFVVQAFGQWPAPCGPSPTGWSSSPALVLAIQP